MEKVEVRTVHMDDPTFYTGSNHVAHITLRNPTLDTLIYAVELMLTGKVPFGIYAGSIELGPGAQGVINVSVPVPSNAADVGESAQYVVSLSIKEQATEADLGTWTADELVIITVQLGVVVVGIGWD